MPQDELFREEILAVLKRVEETLDLISDKDMAPVYSPNITPDITVQAPEVKVEQNTIDLSELLTKVETLIDETRSNRPTSAVNSKGGTSAQADNKTLSDIAQTLKSILKKDANVTIVDKGAKNDIELLFSNDHTKSVPVRLVNKDGSSFYNAMSQLMGGASEDQRMSFTEDKKLQVATSPLDKYGSYAIDVKDQYDFYFGNIDANGNWLIERMNKDTLLSEYALGTSDIAVVWSDRANLEYQTFDKVF